jgi:Fe/S biogenesis protein NfuA
MAQCSDCCSGCGSGSGELARLKRDEPASRRGPDRRSVTHRRSNVGRMLDYGRYVEEDMSQPLLIVTAAAASKILSAKRAEERAEVALRVTASEAGAKFRYELKLVAADTRSDDDEVVRLEGIDIYVDAGSANHLRGATLDYVDDISGSGLKFQNPNKTTLASHPLAERVQEVLDDRINPGLAGHGGVVSLVDIQGSQVVLSFGGGCQGCGMVDVTLKDGVATQLTQQIPEISEVLDVTDHTAGENPYYA